MSEALRGYSECFVCGDENAAGVQARFLPGAAGEVRAEFTAAPQHRGYPDRLHGGILASVLDETLGRAVALNGHWTYTARLEVRYRQAVPLGARVEVVARQVHDRGRFVQAEGEARLSDGQVIAEASGLFHKLTPAEEAELRASIWPDTAAPFVWPAHPPPSNRTADRTSSSAEHATDGGA